MFAQTRRKRTKTFTGCWTCRTRKIKCDEAKPSCRQCHEKGLDCEGYSARLQWLPPVRGASVLHAVDSPEPPTTRSLRRLLPVEPPETILDHDQVDRILRYLDSIDPTHSDTRETSTNIKNFGVFNIARGPCSNVGDLVSATTKAYQREDIVQPGLDIDSLLLDLDYSPDNPKAEAWHLYNLDEQSLQLDLLLGDPTTLVSSQGAEDKLPLITANEQCQWLPIASEDRISSVADHNIIDELQLALPPTNTLEPQAVPNRERFLMSHYMTRVITLFCVIDNAKSPWKTIHLPRVLQCASELSFGGTTTRIRNALRKSLLSISAINLSNDYRARGCIADAESWGNVGSRYGYEAIGLLKYAVETDFYAVQRPKYKEFLATMLSMITINVMSGDTSTCSVHLDGAERLISHMGTRKSTFSRKAQSLHRICLYLRVIYESTAVRILNSGVSRFSSSLDPRTFGPRPIVPKRHVYFEDEKLFSSTAPSTLSSDIPQSDMFAYESIYGIPQTLLILLKESIELIDELNSQFLTATNDQLRVIPEPLAPICDNLEQKIMDWPLEDPLLYSNDIQDANSISAIIIYHQTRAFLNALIIFFSQSVRMLSHRYLRQYVQAILDSIEEVETLKAQMKIHAAPLFWPAFMGATEAFEPQQQDRFRQWYATVSIYGIEAVRTGLEVIHEVWRLEPPSSANRQMFSGWRGVIQKRGDCLMLT
ncbi:hypothetical protein BDW74DRAFT_174344 [Aspergillus multicolor]|uniref:Zn(II)2Cys6 transcription factor n=1 Tax=Aspergillus multicolor TaxID=41759 RepID=UPI003CCD5E68